MPIVPVNRLMGSDTQVSQRRFGLGASNEIGYVQTTIWPSRCTVGYEERWAALTARIADLVEQDPECQRILREELTAEIFDKDKT